jgi:hypothetical protein
LETNIQREQYNANNTSLMKNVLQSSQIALESFKANLDPDLHPVNTNLVTQNNKFLALSNNSALYSFNLATNS